MTHAPDLVPDPIRALWQEAARFIAFVLHQFSREHIRAGIRRATGARLSIWLSEAESALRRLIFIAALNLTPAPQKQRSLGTPTPRATEATTRSFRIFSLYGSGVARTPRWTQPREPAPYAHIRFPSDPILALGRIPTRRPTHRHNGGPILPRPKQRNPLDRWVRLSRNDPDWRPSAKDGVFIPFADFDYTVVREPPDEDAPKRKRKQPLRLDSCADWRRHHDEWQKLVPAPILAARLDALERAMARPEALIQRTARRLRSQRERTLTLARAATPNTKPPRRARHIETGKGALAPGAHNLIPACDSS